MPAWLEAILNGNVDIQLPLKDVLKDSLYYPASGLNGTPVKYLAGNVWSYIYADYAIERDKYLYIATSFPGHRIVE